MIEQAQLRQRRPFIVITTILWLLATGLAAAVMWPIYQNAQFVLLVGIVSVAGATIAVLGAIYRWGGMVILGLMAAVYLVLGVPVAVPSQAIGAVLPSFGGLGTLLTATALSWKRLITIDLPIGSYQALLVPAFMLVLICSCVGLTIALRARRAEWAALLPVGVFLAGNLLGSVTELMPITLTAALFGTILAWFGWRAWYLRRVGGGAADGFPASSLGGADHRRSDWRAITGTVLILALAGGLAAAAVTYIPPEQSRQVLRSQIQQPFNPRAYTSPLVGFRTYLQPENVDEVMVTVAGLPPDARVRIATLDAYDGVAFRVGTDADNGRSGNFTRVASRVDRSSVVGDRVDVQVQIGAYSGVWLPTVGDVESVDFLDSAARLQGSFFYNTYSGTAVVVTGLSGGEQYRLHTLVPRTSQPITRFSPGDDPISLVGIPPELMSVLGRWVDAEDPPGQQLSDALSALVTTGYISHGIAEDEPASNSGHSEARIAQLFSSSLMIGDAEQYAVAAALMARALGFPSRVVMGFAGESGQTEFRGGDISAWIEVQTTDGWVGIDPVPPVRELPADQTEKPTVVPRPQSVVQPPKDVETRVDGQRTPENAKQTEQEAVDPFLQLLGSIARVGGLVLLGLSVLTAPFLTVIAAKLRRRLRRRGRGDPRNRVEGAWAEYRDVVIDNGYQLTPALTRLQVADVIGSVGAVQLAELTDRAAFAPEDSSETDALTAWANANALVAEIGAGRTRWQRLRAAVSLRSLAAGYHGPNRLSFKRRK